MRECYSLACIMWKMLGQFSAKPVPQEVRNRGLAFGGPVVPLEKFKKATFVFASPWESFLSVKVDLGALLSWVIPISTSV